MSWVSELAGVVLQQAAEKLIPAQKVRPQWLKPHSKQCSYRSAEALRHPKIKREIDFFRSLLGY
jgi:hypothetical protein